MGETGELLLSNLISSYNERHKIYRSQYNEFTIWLGLMFFGVLGTPIIILFVWLLGEEDLIEKTVSAIGVLLVYGIFGAGLYWVVMKSRKKLNELKAQLEYGGFRICRNKYNENVIIVGASKVKESYTIVEPFHNVDFKKYNKLFEI